MKKRFGFTLAEVLITLGIVGVVAALTAPALVKNSSQAKVGPSLAKFVNTMENAADALLADKDANTLTNAVGSNRASKIMGALGAYTSILPFENNTTYTYSSIDGKTSETVTMLNSVSVSGENDTVLGNGLYKLDSMLVSYNIDGEGDCKAKGVYKGSIAAIIVDIDGIGGKNKTGIDVFAFYLDNAGHLVPYGSSAHKYLVEKDIKTCSTQNSDLWEGLACTGEIADNGWKVPKKK